MNLRQQIVQENVELISKNLATNDNIAFSHYVHSLYTDSSIHTFDENDYVDGGQDKQLDIITIQSNDDDATIFVLQTKYTNSFSSNTIILIKNGLNWLFNKTRSDLNTLTNIAFKDKIIEYRALQSSLGPSNLNIKVAYITNGLRIELSDESRQEIKSITDEYDNDTFASFTFDIWGADEIVTHINKYDKRDKKIDAKIKIRYDANSPSLIKYHTQGLKGIVCTASASEIARIVNEDSTGSIFDLNIRRFLGPKGSVNSDILNTAGDKNTSYLFWFLNNGITIICDSADAVTDPDDPHLNLINLQIVNGCQTSTSLAFAEMNKILAPDTRVLLRIYETNDVDLVNRIVLTTNNQNKISGRNLKSNDPIQQDMARSFELKGYFYERKPREFDVLKDVNSEKIIPNEDVGLAYLAIVLKKPSDARSRKYKVWSEYYDKIFNKSIVEPYLIVTIFQRQVNLWLQKNYYLSSEELKRFLAKNAMCHIARIAAFLWFEGDDWNNTQKVVDKFKIIDSEPKKIHQFIKQAFLQIEELIIDKQYDLVELNSVLKSYDLDSDIEKMLHL